MASSRDTLIVTHLLAILVGVVVGMVLPPLSLGSRPTPVPKARIAAAPAVTSNPNAGADRSVTPAGSSSASVADASGLQLQIPVQGVRADQLLDTYTQARSDSRVHNAIDIMAAEGTPVLAAADGRLVKLYTSAAGGLTAYQFLPGDRFSLYYAHLSAYAPGLTEGQFLRRGQVLGYVGHTGNASPDAPHLHFAVNALAADDGWSNGTPLNPYPLLQRALTPAPIQ